MSRLLVRIVALVALGIIAVGCGGGTKKVALGDLSATDHGTKDVSTQSSVELEADSFYFSPTFLRGSPGQKLQVSVSNESKDRHNFSVPALALDKDIEAKQSGTFDITFPASGVLLFLCKYHSAQGMNGEILAGDAKPQAASTTVVQPTVKVANNSTLGKILTDNAGKTLYTFKNDVANSGKSVVSGNTAVVWPPFTLASGEPVKPQEIGGALALITREDGSKQVTYNGMPLYYYNKDVNPGDTNGQGVGGVWFAATTQVSPQPSGAGDYSYP